MKELSKPFFLASIVGGNVLALILYGIGLGLSFGASDVSELGPTLTLYLLAFIPVVLVAVVFAILIYRCWAAIQDGHASTTPGKAVGFLFIPFFNLYWVFRAIHGYSKEYNAYLERHGIPAPKLPENLFLTYCVLVLVALVPVVGLLAILANIVVLFFMASQMVDSVNALSELGADMEATA